MRKVFFSIAVLFLTFFATPGFCQDVQKNYENINLLEMVSLARDVLKNETAQFEISTALVSSKNKKGEVVRRKTFFISRKETLVALLTSENEVRLIRLVHERKRPSAIFETRIADTSSCSVSGSIGSRANEMFVISCDGIGELMLAALKIIDADGFFFNRPTLEGRAKRVIYSSYADEYRLPEVILSGKAYFEGQVALAGEELSRTKAYSRAVPQKLITEIFRPDMLFHLGINEHIDHDEFWERGPAYTTEKVLVRIAMNREEAMRYTRSRAGALCLMQIMPFTYDEVRRLYPEARLPRTAEEGACGSHKDAVKTAYLVLDSKLAHMPDDFKEKFLKDPATYGVFLAVAYNGGQKRAIALYRKMHLRRLQEILDNFQEVFLPKKQEFRVMMPETWIYIKKYVEIVKRFPPETMDEPDGEKPPSD